MSSERQTRDVVQAAHELGFDRVAIASARPPLQEEYARYEAFLAAGYAGELSYLEENREARRGVDHDGMLPGARSVICLARSYKRADEASDPPFARRLARYARGRDYHTVVRKKLRQLAAFVRRQGPDVAARPLADDAPILERAWAARAGLGFVGKHGLLISPGVGSYVLLGEVLTTLELEPTPPVPERCGSCTRCLDACPTAAFPAPFVLDARRCLAYLNIEREGEIDPAIEPQMGSWLFGCDVCQEVCPFNASKQSFGVRTDPFRPHPRWAELDLLQLLNAEPSAASAEWLQGTPLARAGLDSLARNAAVVLGNEGFARDSAAHRALAEVAQSGRSEVLRASARRALSRGVREP